VILEIVTGVAGLGTFLTGIGALAAWRQSKANMGEMKTNHGMRAGEYLELIHSDMQDMRMQMHDDVSELRTMMMGHITDRDSHN
jgi:hypothetical protein